MHRIPWTRWRVVNRAIRSSFLALLEARQQLGEAARGARTPPPPFPKAPRPRAGPPAPHQMDTMTAARARARQLRRWAEARARWQLARAAAVGVQLLDRVVDHDQG